MHNSLALDVEISRILNENQFIFINIWTAADNPIIPGANVGHISIETPYGYISLWPEPLNRVTLVHRNELSKPEAIIRNIGRYFTARPPKFVQNYRMDACLEGLSEHNIQAYAPDQPKPEGHLLVLYNVNDASMKFDTEDLLSEYRPSPDEILLWVRPVEANIRVALYSLNISEIQNTFENLIVTGWTLVGSNIFTRSLLSETTENCASIAYRLLTAAGIQALLSMSQRSFFSSETSSVVKPDILAKRILEAKLREQNLYPETFAWKKLGESDVAILKAQYNENESFRIATLKDEEKSTGCCVM